MKRRGSSKKLKKLILHTALALALIAALTAFFVPLGADIELRRTEAIHSSVMNAALRCYAQEGVYPGELSYLEEHYGLMINHSAYIVSYDCYAANIAPEVRVLKR